MPPPVWQAHGVDGAALQLEVAGLTPDLDANGDGVAESLSFALVFTSHRLLQ
ncbi:MAG: hypothetical protein H6747_10795 [Deltaproteobacteria bacterium]|nr:hypothetical protein [Deltaproteobacteria bacterium]